MTVTVKMFAPAFQAGFNVTAASGTAYTADANGLITASPGDAVSLAQAGCIAVPDYPVVTLSTGGYVVQGAINIIPSTAGSTVSYAYLLAAPAYVGMKTVVTQPSGSTAASTVTSSGSNLNLTNTNATVLTFTAAGTVDLYAAGSTLYNVLNRTPTQSSAGAALVFQPASS